LRIFADIILPIPLDHSFCYSVPEEFHGIAEKGMRVVVPFGRKLQVGIIERVHQDAPEQINIKAVMEFLDDFPVVTAAQLKLWRWTSDYYLTPLGVLVNSTLPKGMSLASKTFIYPAKNSDNSQGLSDDEILVLDGLSTSGKLSLDEVTSIVQKKKVMGLIQKMLQEGLIQAEKEYQERYQYKKIKYARLSDLFLKHEEELYVKLKRAKRQMEIVDFLMELDAPDASFHTLFKDNGFTTSALRTLVKKEIIEIEEKKIDRKVFYAQLNRKFNLPPKSHYKEKLEEMVSFEMEHKVVLLEEDVRFGKVWFFIEEIKRGLEKGRDVLFLIPDMVLYPQYFSLFEKEFPGSVVVYHSLYNENERVEIWKKIADRDKREACLVICTRIGVFLPFDNLGTIIVDEEQDVAYKQMERQPHYHCRDLAIVLGKIHNADILLSSVCPSLESIHNVDMGKYAYINLNESEGVEKKAIHFVDLKQNQKNNTMHSHFSFELIQKIESVLKEKKQVLIFKDRRGYAVRMECQNCKHIPHCKHCTSSLTYHKRAQVLKCHLCGYHETPQVFCSSCKKPDMKVQGFGTEKVFEKINEFFPEANVHRMDKDVISGKYALQDMIDRFDSGEIDILIGTRLIAKGLDYSNTGLAAIVAADDLLYYPDLRSYERAFQTYYQIYSRVQGKDKHCPVWIQTFQKDHEVLKALKNLSPSKYYHHLKLERKEYFLPPFSRLVKVKLRHKNGYFLHEACEHVKNQLHGSFKPNQILGPMAPAVDKIRDYYIQEIILKFPKSKDLNKKKHLLEKLIYKLGKHDRYRHILCQIDVDPT